MIVKRVGGKAKLAKWIVRNLPRGDIFVDVFGGSGSVLMEVLQQCPGMRCVYNDLDDRLYTFFKVLRDNSTDLAHLTFLTPYARKGFQDAHAILYNDEEFSKLDDINKALLFLIVNRQSFGAKMSNDWSITRDGEINYHTWNSLPEYILRVAKTWKNVFLEHLDYKDVIKKWDSKNTIFYLDPPYENVETDYYNVNKKDGFNHTEMFEELQNIQGSYSVSYYGGEDKSSDTDLLKLYQSAGCKTLRKEVTKHLSTQASKDKATEVLLIKNSGRELLIGKSIKQQEIETV